MSSEPVSELSELAEISAMLLRLLDSENDLPDPRPSTLADIQRDPTPEETRPQESGKQTIPKIVLTTPTGQEMAISPPKKTVHWPTRPASLIPNKRRVRDTANINRNGKKKPTTFRFGLIQMIEFPLDYGTTCFSLMLDTTSLGKTNTSGIHIHQAESTMPSLCGRSGTSIPDDVSLSISLIEHLNSV
ncbi:uncharacterized protein TRIVIDRAFT_64054 [Trichoderma virens Gv29-8]|uniref:Uncharacterized protein n=1 Tax=Hypocrea virens (strain Gv29-8 / FGSC 10586) TaxID=413071 RepID=G9MNQ2_HYPVG|nr:uncharacterized protein TRIVIDRAFT_64054 [Trichoderma virens Gv29-8]EHK23507.1 hypothetical protein TRIVIDRAFT_64054 [Trichoderma virens Gv29-8]UKZ49805.1 hypothetical protein TrVGV298_004058 [Trichoderma virens]